MFRILLLLVFLIPLFTGCSSNGMTNQNDKKIVDCGPLPSGTKYIKLLGHDGQPLAREDLEILSPDSDFAPLATEEFITAKGCLMMKSDQTVFVRNKIRTLGAIIQPSLDQPIKNLDTIKNPFTSLEVGCDSTIYNDGNNFFLKFDRVQGTLEGSFIKIELALLDADNDGMLHQWPARSMEKIIEYSLNDVQLTDSKTYALRPTLYDPFSGNQSVFKCQLRVDHNNVDVGLTGNLLGKVKLFNQEFTVVPTKYEANFYISSGFQDVEVEYCFEKIEEEKLANQSLVALDNCKTTQITSRDKGTIFESGLWQIRFRGLRGHIASPWKSELLVVEKICEKDYLSLAQVKKDGCTRILGNLRLKDSDFILGGGNLGSLLYTVVGDVLLEGVFQEEKLTGLSNLNSVDGHLTFKGQVSNSFDSFKSLEQVSGDLFFNHQLLLDSDITFDGFKNLKKIGGKLKMRDYWPKTLKGFESLEEVDGIELAIDGNETVYMGDFRNLSIVHRDISIGELKNFSPGDINFENFRLKKFGGSLKLINTRIKNLKGLEWIESLEALVIEECHQLKSLDGLSGLKKIYGEFLVLNNRVLEDISTVTTHLKAGSSQVMGNPALSRITGFQQPEWSTFIIHIHRNEGLKNITFGAVEDGLIYIGDNQELESIDGLGLFRIGAFCLADSPSLKNPPKLPDGHKLIVNTSDCG